MFNAAIVGILAFTPTFYAQLESEGITVSGQGIVNAAPDLFVLSVGIGSKDKDVEKARTELARRSSKVAAAAKGFPLDRARSFTTAFTIHPDYRGEEFTGYRLFLSMQFAITDLSRAEEFTVTMIKAGATNINSMEYTLKNPEELWMKAREAAAADALRQARSLAKVLGLKPGTPLTIRMISKQLILGCAFDEQKMLAVAGLAADDRLNLIPPGNVKAEASVQVRFALVPLGPAD